MDPFMPYCEGSSAGVMAGILQGQPVEAESTRALHLETSHIMSAYSLTHIFHHVYSVVGWSGSTADRMLHLLRKSRNGTDNPYYGGGIQEGFGLLCAEAGIQMRDWSRAYRSPYWNHRRVVDWTGATANFTMPMSRALFVPIQMLHGVGAASQVKSCCLPKSAACKGTARSCIVDNPLLPDSPDCCAKEANFVLPPSLRMERLLYSTIDESEPWKAPV